MFLLLVLLLLHVISTIQQETDTCRKYMQQELPEPPCKPRDVVKVTDFLNKVTPQAVTVMECSGYSPDRKYGHRARNYLCVPTHFVEYDVELCGDDGVVEIMTFRNHTECSMECVCQLNGYQCPGNKVSPNVPCPEGMVYDEQRCQCRVVDTKADPSTKKEGGLGSISVEILFLSLVGEFMLIVFCILAFSYLRRHGVCAPYTSIPGVSRSSVVVNVTPGSAEVPSSNPQESTVLVTVPSNGTHKTSSQQRIPSAL